MSAEEIKTAAAAMGALIAAGGALWGMLHAVVVKPLRAEITQAKAELEGKIAGLEGKTGTGLAGLRTELAEVRTEMAEMETRLVREIHRETPRILPGR
jgi:hypothetical protein